MKANDINTHRKTDRPTEKERGREGDRGRERERMNRGHCSLLRGRIVNFHGNTLARCLVTGIAFSG